MTSYALTVIADTAGVFADFGPYVPSINTDGTVAFQATLKNGGTGVYTGSGGPTSTIVAQSEDVGEIVSHPDINRDGKVCFYAHAGKDRCVFLASAKGPLQIAPNAGPLGPTMNDRGTIAFRATLPGDRTGIFTWHNGIVTRIAESGSEFAAFHGLPVVNNRGTIVFRADLTNGGQCIAAGNGETPAARILATGDTYSNFGSFPFLNDEGTIATCATLRTGESVIVTVSNGAPRIVMDSSGQFESFRGALLDAAGRIIFYATPKGGNLGVYRGPNPQSDRLIGIGAPLLDSTVTDFALHPVSINGAGQLALRISLADQRRFILRAEPEKCMST